MRTPLTFIALLISGFSFAQLVNGGFETCSSYPSSTGQWQVVQGWNNAGSLVASPDYFHYSASAAADIPETPMAIVEAFEGQGIMGLIACGRQFTNLREYLTAAFESPMQIGMRYRISFRLTNGYKTAVSTGGLAVDQLGLFLSTSQPIQDAQLPLLAVPQLIIDDVFFSEDWQRVSFSFTADQPYLYMTFGVFGTDDDKNIIIADGLDPVYAYYFFDDVRVVKNPDDNRPDIDPIEREPEARLPDGTFNPEPFYVPNSFTPNGDGFNDTFKPIGGAVSEWEFAVFNSWGERVFFTEDESQGWSGHYNSKRADNGAYVWEVRYSVFDEEAGWLLKDERGVVTLIR